MTKLEQVEAAVRKACPETMELRFGCYIETFKYSFNGTIEKVICVIKDGEEVVECHLNGRDDKIKVSQINKILGHELRLEHVLRALGNAWQEDFSVGINGDKLNMAFVDEDVQDCGVEHKCIIVTYNLTKPLKDQSPELIDFLFNIFYSNESNKR